MSDSGMAIEHSINVKDKTPGADSRSYITSLHQHYIITGGTKPAINRSEDICHHWQPEVYLGSGNSQDFMTPLLS